MLKYYKCKFKAKLDQFEKINLIQKLFGGIRQGKYTFSTFVVLKKNTKEIYFILHIRELSKYIIRCPFLVLLIRNTLNNIKGFQYITIINISMEYYCNEVGAELELKYIITIP